MLKIFFGVVCISALSCSSRPTIEDKPNDKKNFLQKRGVTADTCSFCAIDSLLVVSMDSDIKTNIVIDYPVAIELMDRAEWVFKYQEENYDTLMTLLEMENAGDRNEIYRLYDLSGYYAEGIKPVLIDNGVTIIDTLKHQRYVTIRDRGKKYLIDLLRYRKDDGVLMFKPGKPPIYWTMKKDWENCYGYYGFAKWYYNCH